MSALRAVRGVLTDIDDTLTTDGVLTAQAYAAMERVKLRVNAGHYEIFYLHVLKGQGVREVSRALEVIDRNARKGERPSDHAPVLVEFAL